MQDCSISIANALGKLQPYTKLSIDVMYLLQIIAEGFE